MNKSKKRGGLSRVVHSGQESGWSRERVVKRAGEGVFSPPANRYKAISTATIASMERYVGTMGVDCGGAVVSVCAAAVAVAEDEPDEEDKEGEEEEARVELPLLLRLAD